MMGEKERQAKHFQMISARETHARRKLKLLLWIFLDATVLGIGNSRGNGNGRETRIDITRVEVQVGE